MARLLILALDRGSRGPAAAAADIVRRLPRDRFTCAFLTAPGAVAYVNDLGYPALALDRGSAEANREALDGVVASFRPDRILVADEPALRESADWSGADLAGLRERYPVPLVCLDRFGRGAAPVEVDGCAEAPRVLPGLAEDCDLVLRCAPLFAPGTKVEGATPIALTGGGLRVAASMASPPRHPRSRVPVIFVSEPRGPARSLADALPRIMHDHLAALGRPLRIDHIGGTGWSFPIAEQLEYGHLATVSPSMHRERMLAADLFLTANVASTALCQAALSGVPALVLYQPPEDGLPFRAGAWGWYRLLTDALRDNPYAGCFLSARIAARAAVLDAATELLDDGDARSALYERQLGYRADLAALPAVADVLWSAVTR